MVPQTTAHRATPTGSSDPTAHPNPAPAPAAVVARGLALHGERGVVYGPVDLDVPADGLTVVQGPQGAGRSSLLLTLAGRMVPDTGSSLTVLGRSLPRERDRVQREAAVAGFAGIDELDDSVTVGEVVRERLAWLAPWYRRVPRVDQRTFTTLARPVFGERPLPRVTSVVWDLDEVDTLLLRVTLAMAQRPRLLVVDDVDQVHDTTRRATLWSRLEAIAEAGTTVVASVASLDEVARTAWRTPVTRVTLATGPHAVPATDAA
ncbi:ATP-binding cassette domain-containing protein [Cellulomonas palmilytica]|uniref:ATP-binding cassette domain-containing protein n=1 Tax=Cellulomonas palmilytica TaxID=2608402 RepID=UPI001F3260E4|nr:ATP-binding cassette domain-containing protein [Cellulomonas palmilytica]UJP39308.1 AAA family ATPase [Cellulomonas palmilytica]